jgi:hypothetical protein
VRTPSRRLAALFYTALLGVVVVVAIVAHALAGAVGVAGWLGVVTGLLVLAVVQVRRLVTPPGPAQRCTCCDGDHSATVRVV